MVAVVRPDTWAWNQEVVDAFLGIKTAIEGDHVQLGEESPFWTVESMTGTLQHCPPRSCPHCSCLVAMRALAHVSCGAGFGGY